jgi:hypothetical protein
MLAIGADIIAPYHYTTPNFGRNFEFPNREFLLGTDHLARCAQPHYLWCVSL